MTLIGATKIKNKWTILADSAVTIWQVVSDANSTYRPKIRELRWKNITLITAGCGVIRDIDFASNILERRLENQKFKTKNELKYFIQDNLAYIYKDLKELTSDPQFEMLILEPKSDTLFVCDDYSVTEPKGYATIVLGTWDTKFYKSSKINQFFDAFKHAVECDEYCDFPIISYRDWKVDTWYWMECSIDFNNLVCNNEPEEETHSECFPIFRDSEWFICGWADKAL